MSDDELFELLITGQLEPGDPTVVEAFRERPELATRWRELQELQQVLTRAGTAGAPETLAPERVDRVQRLVHAKLPPRRPWLLPVLLTAAAMLLGAGLLLWQQAKADEQTYLDGKHDSRVRRLARRPEEVVNWPDAGIMGRYKIQIFTRGEGARLLHEDTSSDTHYALNELAKTLPNKTQWIISWVNGDLISPHVVNVDLD